MPAKPYNTLAPPFRLRFQEMSKTEIEGYFRWFFEVFPQRIRELVGLVRDTPGFERWDADNTPKSLEVLGEWFANQVELRNRTPAELQVITDKLVFPMDVSGEELTSRTFSIAFDVGVYFGQVLVTNLPTLRWKQASGSKNSIDCGQPLLTGFVSHLTLNPVRIGVTLAYGLAARSQSGSRLREVHDYWAARAPLMPDSIGELRGN